MSGHQVMVPVNRELTVAVSRQLSMVDTIIGQSLVHDGVVPVLVPQIGEREHISAVAFSPDGRFAFSGRRSGFYQWDLATGYCLTHIELENNSDGYVSSFSTDCQFAISLSNYCVTLWDVTSGKCINKFVPDAKFQAVELLPENKKILSGHGDGTLRLWDIASGDCLKVMSGHTGSVYSVAISTDGHLALSGTYEDEFVLLWNLTTGQLLQKFQGYTGYISRMIFLPNRRPALITVCDDKTRRLWDLSSGQCLWVRKDNMSTYGFSPEGSYILCGPKMKHRGNEKEKELQLLDASTGDCIQLLKGQFAWSTAAFSPDGARILTGGRDATLSLWDVNSGHCSIMGTATQMARCVATSKDYIAFRGGNEKLWLWHIVSNNFQPCFCRFKDSNVSFSQDGQLFFSWGYENDLKVWNISTGQCLHVLKGHSSRVVSVDFSSDGRNVLSQSKDDVKTWDVKSGNCLETISKPSEHKQPNSPMDDYFSFFDKPFDYSKISFAMLPDINVIISSDGTSLKIRDVDTDSLLASMSVFEDGSWYVLSPDGHYDSSDNGDSAYLRWTVGMESYPVSYFKARFHVPGLLGKVMFRDL
jgi:WD40 repeat protein